MNRLTPQPRQRTGRRSGFARRDSNLALLGALVSGAVIAFALLLLVVARVNPEQGSRLRGATADALSPLISVATAPVDAARQLGEAVRAHLGVVARNRMLEAELQNARTRAAQADALAADVRRLEGLIGLQRPERRVVASAVASATSASGGVRGAIISVGLRDGVQPRMPVLAADGLAGRVTDVGTSASRIMLLTDASSRVPVKVLRTGWTGLAVGTGGTMLDFLFDPASGADQIRNGDRLVSSGDGGLFPPGVPVAVVTDALANPPRARPLANPTGLGTVLIEAPWLPPPTLVPAPPATAEADLPVAETDAPAPAGASPGTAPAGAALAPAPARAAAPPAPQMTP